MTAHFDEFEEEMTSRSLERAYDYVDEHRIGGLEEVSAGLFHAEVHGSELYDVDIRLRGNDIVFASCTCPYDYDGYCKHIGAVLLTLRDYKHGGNHQQNVTYDAMIAKQDDSRPDIPVAANPLASKPEVFNRVLQHIRERVGLRKSERWTPAQHFYLVWNQDEINAIVTANPAIASGMEPLMPESTVDRVMESPHAATSRQGLRLEIRMGRCRHKRRDGRIRGSRTIERLSAGHETHVRGFAKNSVVRETSR